MPHNTVPYLTKLYHIPQPALAYLILMYHNSPCCSIPHRTVLYLPYCTTPHPAVPYTSPCCTIPCFILPRINHFVVLMGSSYECQTRKFSPLTGPSGYLSSSVAARTTVGSSSCPWGIRVDPGQRINVTLLNFVSVWTISGSTTDVLATSGSGPATGSGKSGELCYDVAVIREGTAKRSVTACSSEPRMRSVYISGGSTIDVEFSVRNVVLLPVPTPSVQFLIYYEGIVLIFRSIDLSIH